MARSINDERRAQSVKGMHDQGAVNYLGEAGASVGGKRTHARAIFEGGCMSLHGENMQGKNGVKIGARV